MCGKCLDGSVLLFIYIFVKVNVLNRRMLVNEGVASRLQIEYPTRGLQLLSCSYVIFCGCARKHLLVAEILPAPVTIHFKGSCFRRVYPLGLQGCNSDRSASVLPRVGADQGCRQLLSCAYPNKACNSALKRAALSTTLAVPPTDTRAG